ncbi:hypothetical protein [Actinoplanes subtropicus]|uniref:hypothetical protein n=1 Tax=Actinoplanes subtropicus TaxID=543632 RepID=UPI0004C3FE6F|nr:hypothetical protein [Actinoplanes subtropicus]
MPSDRDRLLLAPHLPLLRAAQAELATAQRAYDEAERQATESTTGTDWRDRLLGGLLSVDEGRSRRYRQARGTRKAADETLAAARARYTRYAERIDGLLEPILIRDDPGYQRKLAAVRVCDQAVRAAEEMRFSLSSALAKPAVTKPARNARDTTNTESWHEAEFARQRFDELVTELRSSVPALRRTIDRAARALAESTGTPPPERPTLDVAALPQGRPAAMAAEQHLRGLRVQLEVAVRELTRWRTRADESRLAALRAAADAL